MIRSVAIATRRIIVTGAPGSGKTTVLAAAGLDHVGEPARQIHAEHPGAGFGHDEFVARLLKRSIRTWHAADADGPVVFDRGIPDCGAYARYLGVDAAACDAAAQRYRYHPEVLLLEPWEAIYITDELRIMTFEMTVAFHEAVLEAFAAAGYRLVPVPRAPLPERAAFVADFVAATPG